MRFSFYAMSEHDAYVIFTTNDHPNLNADDAYEIGEVIVVWPQHKYIYRITIFVCCDFCY